MALLSDAAIKCDMPNCRIHTFLPYKCKLCNLNYCDIHSTTEEHCCPFKENDSPKIICDYCDILLVNTQEEIEKHLIHECTYKKKKKKSLMICNMQNCKTVLNGINDFKCKQCNMLYCLKHRYPEVHQCQEKKKKKQSFIKNENHKCTNFLKTFFTFKKKKNS